MAVSDQLRQAITNSGKSQLEIETATGISQPSLSNFMRGKRGLRLADFDKLASYFGLSLQPDEPSAAAKSKVKAPAVPAVDWGSAEPAGKRKAESAPGPTPPAKAKGTRKAK